MTRPYAEVIGSPIAHSKSPRMHGFWLDRLGIDAEYRATRVAPGELDSFLHARRGDPLWRGCNVTLPHKVAVSRLTDEVDPIALEVGAVNTIVATGNQLRAYNTDVEGVLQALPATILPPGSEPCLVGTGGAARAALAAFNRRNIGIVLITARDEAKGWALLKEFGFGGTVRPFDDSHNPATADVIINASSLGMAGATAMPAAFLGHLAEAYHETYVFDMVYAPLETPLLSTARSRGLRTIDGLQMLIGQAAAAFELFFGKAAPREHDAELRALLTA